MGTGLQIGAKHRVHGKTVKEIWDKFVNSGSVSPRKRISGNPSKLGLGELQAAARRSNQNAKAFGFLQAH